MFAIPRRDNCSGKRIGKNRELGEFLLLNGVTLLRSMDPVMFSAVNFSEWSPKLGALQDGKKHL